jgi:hypothetical protein
MLMSDLCPNTLCVHHALSLQHYEAHLAEWVVKSSPDAPARKGWVSKIFLESGFTSKYWMILRESSHMYRCNWRELSAFIVM